MADEKDPAILVEHEQIAVGRGYQVCIKLNDDQARILTELVGRDKETPLTELRINVDDLADLASVIAN